MTLTDREYQVLRDAAAEVIRAVGVETGGSNVQFALNRDTGEIVVIEMNPRVSRSSALASKATGYPIAKVATKLAIGYTLDEIPNDITGTTPASFEPALDYVVVKLPRFAFEKFPGADAELTTQMKSVGEAMGIGRSFNEAWGKAMRSRELDGIARDRAARSPVPSWDRFDVIAARLLAGDDARRRWPTSPSVHPWFLRRVAARGDGRAGAARGAASAALDAGRLAAAEAARHRRRPHRRADRRRASARCAAARREPACARSTRRSTAAPPRSRRRRRTTTRPTSRRTSCAAATARACVILGSGPNRIGQGIEFDYCCVQAAQTFRALGYDAVMVNCNPETVSTDYDTSDRLYFEPLTVEDVLEVIEREQPIGVVAQFGGQTPLGLARRLERGRRAAPGHAVRGDRRGRGPRAVRRACWLDSACRRRPGAIAAGVDEAAAIAAARSATRCWCGPPTCSAAVRCASATTSRCCASRPVQPELAGRPLRRGRDRGRRGRGLRRRRRAWIGAVMQHVEEAGVHSRRLGLRDPDAVAGRRDRARDPRADARDRPGAGRARADQRAVRGAGRAGVRDRGEPAGLAHGAVRRQGHRPQPGRGGLPGRARRLAVDLAEDAPEHISVKAAVLPFQRFFGADPALGPEMRSTGEVMGIGPDFPTAFAKAERAAGRPLPANRAACSCRCATPTSRPRRMLAAAAAVARLRSGRHRRHRPRAAADRHPRGDGPKVTAGVAERGRPDP